MNTTGVRVVSGIVMVVVFLLVDFWFDGGMFAAAIASLSGFAMWEWAALCGVTHPRSRIALGLGLGIIAWILQMLAIEDQSFGLVKVSSLLATLFWIGVVALLYLQPVKPVVAAVEPLSLLSAALVLLSTALGISYLHTVDSGGPWLLLYAMSLVWLMDTGAYFVGRSLGKNKLAPRISPGKTREGVIGGVVVTLLVTIVVFELVELEVTGVLLLATVVAAVISVVGDLYESRLKRAAGVKDSSALIPGHGGVLDRIDGVVAAIPMFVFILVWF